MSEAASRSSATRGRGSGRGGRGGFAGRGGRRTNGDKTASGLDSAPSAFDDEGDVGELRKQYGNKTSLIKEVFSDWSEVDILFALQETDGDENEAISRIAEGTISQWGEVSKQKKTTKPKAKDTPPPATTEISNASSRPARGGRAVSEGRGRGRASDRGGRGGRGGRVAQAATNGARNKENQHEQLSVPTEESSAWSTEMPTAPAEPPAADTSAPVETVKPAAPQAKTWASMLRQSTVPKPASKPKPQEPAPAPAPEHVEAPEPTPAEEPAAHEPEPEPTAEEQPTPVAPSVTVEPPVAVIESEVALSPSHDELTETNLEQVVDVSKPPATDTAASTTADSWDPRQNNASTNATPLSAAQQQHQGQKQASSGFAASAIKATTARTPVFPRRVLDQEEAVRMPGNREVDRAAVQFGAFNLNGGEEDIDGDREDPETRAQPPADSPVAQPRASLPPVAQPSSGPESYQQKSTINPPPGVTPHGSQAPVPTQPSSHAPGQFGRFGQDASAQQKPIDPFQNTPSTQHFDTYSTPTSQAAQTQQPGGAFTSAPDYSNYYATAGDRHPYANYYGQQFGQHAGAQGQDNAPGQQRPFGGYNASQQADNLSQYPQSGAGIHGQSRFGTGSNEAHNSGHSTPNPTTQAAQQAQQQAGAPGSQPQTQHGHQYPGYNPYYSHPYFQQYQQYYNQGGFGPYGNKGGMYPSYGMSPNAPFDHSNSPASFAQSSLHRDGGIGSGLGDYGRANSGQGGGAPGLGGASGFDSFSRGASSFQNQGQGFNSQNQGGNPGAGDDLKPFGDSKPGAGPSPSIGGARPGSATAGNNASNQSNLPPPQSSQMGAGGYGGYPSHLQGHGLHGSGGFGMSGAGGANQHGNSPYGSYGQGGFNSGAYYSGNQQQQQPQQQQRGWGGNYH